jgi:ABC-type uncharacterized transport system substrate-binding protein
MKIVRLILSILLFIIFIPVVWAHPHVFAENNVVFDFNGKGLTGVKIRWTFDELYSSSIIMDYDKNRDRTFEPDEAKKLARQAMADLKLNHYFTYVRVNGRDFPVNSIKDFQVAINQGRVVYSFCVPCPISVRTTEQSVDVSCYDENYYIAISTSYQKAATVVNKFGFNTFINVSDDEESFCYFGQIIPQKITLKFWR